MANEDDAASVGREAQRWARRLWAAVASTAVVAAIWLGPDDLSQDGRITLTVTALTIVGWTLTRLGETQVALAGALSLALAGVLDDDDFYETLGHELIWLMLAAFVMAAALKASGLVERATLAVSRAARDVTTLFYALTFAIAATALFIPSTSGRAALLLPVFLSISRLLRAPAYSRALALLFPTTILLSAGGSLIGAGAHLVAVETLDEKSDRSLGYFDWIALNAPLALLACLAATTAILRLFLSKELASRRLPLQSATATALQPRDLALAAILALTILAWVTESWHGVDIGIVAVIGAMSMLQAARPILKSKDAFKSVEVELIVFLAATFAIAEAMVESGVDRWMAERLLAALPTSVVGDFTWVAAFVAAVSLAAHLVITSRTARATVLIPTIVLPLAAIGHDLQTLMLIAIAGSGFCQTLTASAKPVALYANAGVETYRAEHLLRLSLVLAPAMFALLMAFALFVWPTQSGTN